MLVLADLMTGYIFRFSCTGRALEKEEEQKELHGLRIQAILDLVQYNKYKSLMAG